MIRGVLSTRCKAMPGCLDTARRIGSHQTCLVNEQKLLGAF